MVDILYDCGGVKRADLRLRTKYYGIKTKIFLIAKNHYVIQLLNFLDMFDAIKEGDKPDLVVALILLFVFLFFGFSLI